MTTEEVLLAAQAQGRDNAGRDLLSNIPGGIFTTAPIGSVDKTYVDNELLRKQNVIAVQATAPLFPAVNQLWVDTT